MMHCLVERPLEDCPARYQLMHNPSGNCLAVAISATLCAFSMACGRPAKILMVRAHAPKKNPIEGIVGKPEARINQRILARLPIAGVRIVPPYRQTRAEGWV